MQTDRIWTLLARKLAGEISPEEKAEMELLLRENPDAHLKIQALAESWNEEDNSTEEDIETAYSDLTGKLRSEGYMQVPEPDGIDFFTANEPQKKSSLRYLLVAAAILSLLVTGTLFLEKGKKNNISPAASAINTISTKKGSRTKVELPDGSIVWLNSGSSLTYNKNFGQSLREVSLVGEGFFDVVHNADKPFIIHTSFFDIKDLGTQFNVKCYPEDKTTETSLVEGSVEITVKKRPKEKWILKPDEKLVLLNENAENKQKSNQPEAKVSHSQQEPIIAIKKLVYLPQDSFSLETAWTYNKLSFDDEAFSEVAKKMGRWYDYEFEFRNEKLEDIHLNGSFVSETLEEAMEALKYTNRFNYEIKDRRVIIY